MAAENKIKPIQKEAIQQTDTQTEIDEIMNEIENLQKNMSEVVPKAAKAPELKAVPAPAEPEPAEPEPGMEDFHGGGGDVPMEETLASMKEDPSVSGLLDAAIGVQEEQSGTVVGDASTDAPQEEVVSESSQTVGSATEGCLTMKLTGNMTLKLSYEYEGQEVTVSFQDQYLKVMLSDGAEFKIPVGRSERQLKAA